MTPLSPATKLNSQLPVGQAGGILDKRDTDEVLGEEVQIVFQDNIKPALGLLRCGDAQSLRPNTGKDLLLQRLWTRDLQGMFENIREHQQQRRSKM